MTVTVSCSWCRKRIRFKHEAEGRRVKCPACGRILTIKAVDEGIAFAAIDIKSDARTIKKVHLAEASIPAQSKMRWVIPICLTGSVFLVAICIALVIWPSGDVKRGYGEPLPSTKATREKNPALPQKETASLLENGKKEDIPPRPAPELKPALAIEPKLKAKFKVTREREIGVLKLEARILREEVRTNRPGAGEMLEDAERRLEQAVDQDRIPNITMPIDMNSAGSIRSATFLASTKEGVAARLFSRDVVIMGLPEEVAKRRGEVKIDQYVFEAVRKDGETCYLQVRKQIE